MLEGLKDEMVKLHHEATVLPTTVASAPHRGSLNDCFSAWTAEALKSI